MCIHKYYIFLNCGHSFFAPGPLVTCKKATFLPLPPSQHYRLSRKSSVSTHTPFSSTCMPEAHPYRTIRITYGLCLDCEVRRKYLLAQAEQDFVSVVRFDESKWRVQYRSPNGRKGKFRESQDWQQWGEEDMSIETQMKLRQRAQGGRVGFWGQSATKSLGRVVDELRANPGRDSSKE
jgi:hypothetical protein